MHVVWAMLADYAQETPDHRVDIIGGGIARVGAPRFPLLLPLIVLAMRIELDAAEGGQTWPVRVLLWDDDGREIVAPVEGAFEVADVDTPTTTTTHLCVQFHNLVLATAGNYAFRVLIAGRTEASVPLVGYLVPSDRERQPS